MLKFELTVTFLPSGEKMKYFYSFEDDYPIHKLAASTLAMERQVAEEVLAFDWEAVEKFEFEDEEE